MKRWWPDGVYQSKPYVALGAGAVLAVGSVVASVIQGDWGWLAIVCAFGCGLLIYGGIVLQLRREYRQRSKWARHDSDDQRKLRK